MESELHVEQKGIKNHNPKFKSNLLSMFMAGWYGSSSAEEFEGQMFVYKVQVCVVAYTTSLSDTEKKLLIVRHHILYIFSHAK